MGFRGRRKLRARAKNPRPPACHPRTQAAKDADRADSLKRRDHRRVARAVALEAVRSRTKDRARVDRVRVANVGRKRWGMKLLSEAKDDPQREMVL
jgi:hypothetical protein